MNILHVSAVKKWGGGENHLENLCYELQQFAPEVNNIIFCLRKGEFYQKLSSKDLQVVPATLAFKMDPRFFFKLITTCRNQQIDLIHIHDTTALTLCVMGDYFYNLPPFILSKKTSFPIKSRKRTIHKYNYPKIKKVLCVSEETKSVTSNKVEDPGKLTTIYHGTRLTGKSRETPFSLTEKLRLGQGRKIVGNIANHIRAKNLETMIKVADYIVNDQGRKEFYFVQMGSFTKRTESLQKKVEQMNLQDNFYFFGFVPEASNFIPQFDVSLVTSQSEGVPGFIYESFYHKVPVVSTAVGGIPEVIRNDHNGLLAEKYDWRRLAQQVIKLSEDPAKREKFTEASYNLLIRKFTTAKMAEATLAEYKKVLDGRL